ncbi:molybdopterin synthase sulfur carrier subunit [Serratia sp. M24T3]|uniref:molybdopterin synthase sulfur carrier subunit n=1 Tax=Serratia sp. M24T3 TaxID=932213 RepID=UPI00025B9F7A|nr:molybdopterin synthase sulfur carrier subunit [Serratia sp. M24T3]EIC83731.1 molybdopterin synthase small subunit [Serratia sp. M24T3]
MIDILFFAQVRELIGTGSLQIHAEFSNVETLRQALSQRGDRWALALESGKLLVAVNQTLVEPNHPIKAGDEIAFFPPVTGG